jgi:hypothetical protein
VPSSTGLRGCRLLAGGQIPAAIGQLAAVELRFARLPAYAPELDPVER